MSLLKNLAISLLSFCLTIAAVETYLRLTAAGAQNIGDVAGSVAYHETLGWAPKPGFKGTDRLGNPVSILDDGTRANGPSAKQGAQPVIAVGDSFVFGAEVADHESWPARLEQLLGKRVVNGGVCGYGIDQSLLRAEELMKIYNPSLLIFGIFPGDISRSNLAKYYRNKPYFAVAGNSVELRNVPVPRNGALGQFFDKIMQQSFIVTRFFPTYLEKAAHHDEEEVSALLLKRIARAAQQRGIPIIFLVQYNNLDDGIKQQIDRIMSEVRNDGYSLIVDFHEPLQHIMSADPGKYLSFFMHKALGDHYWIGHMNAAGNDFVAASLFDFLAMNRRDQRLSKLFPPQ